MLMQFKGVPRAELPVPIGVKPCSLPHHKLALLMLRTLHAQGYKVVEERWWLHKRGQLMAGCVAVKAGPEHGALYVPGVEMPCVAVLHSTDQSKALQYYLGVTHRKVGLVTHSQRVTHCKDMQHAASKELLKCLEHWGEALYALEDFRRKPILLRMGDHMLVEAARYGLLAWTRMAAAAAAHKAVRTLTPWVVYKEIAAAAENRSPQRQLDVRLDTYGLLARCIKRARAYP